MAAIRAGDLEGVRAALAGGADPDFVETTTRPGSHDPRSTADPRLRSRYDAVMTGRDWREREWLEAEARMAASLTDADRIRILRDLRRTVDAIRRGKTEVELRREEEARRLEDEPARERYIACLERTA